LNDPHDAVAFKMTTDKMHVLTGFHFTDHGSEGVINTPVELGFLDLECIPDPEKLDGNDSKEADTNTQNQEIEQLLIHGTKISKASPTP
jgi:hypothetical protein